MAALIEISVRTLQTHDYTPQQIDAALKLVFGVDTQLIADGTYFIVESPAGDIAACGGWSRRKTLYGGDQAIGRVPDLLNPATDAAKIRAFFVHPTWSARESEHCCSITAKPPQRPKASAASKWAPR